MNTKEDEQGNKGRFNRLNLISFDLTDFIYIYFLSSQEAGASNKRRKSVKKFNRTRKKRKKEEEEEIARSTGWYSLLPSINTVRSAGFWVIFALGNLRYFETTEPNAEQASLTREIRGFISCEEYKYIWSFTSCFLFNSLMTSDLISL